MYSNKSALCAEFFLVCRLNVVVYLTRNRFLSYFQAGELWLKLSNSSWSKLGFFSRGSKTATFRKGGTVANDTDNDSTVEAVLSGRVLKWSLFITCISS